MSEHQDWTPIVIHGKVAPIHPHPHHEVTKEQKLEQEEIGPHEKVPFSMAKMIQQARIAKGFKTQKELALIIGLHASVINMYESGRAIPDPFVLQKLRRVLGVKLKK